MGRSRRHGTSKPNRHQSDSTAVNEIDILERDVNTLLGSAETLEGEAKDLEGEAKDLEGEAETIDKDVSSLEATARSHLKRSAELQRAESQSFFWKLFYRLLGLKSAAQEERETAIFFSDNAKERRNDAKEKRKKAKEKRNEAKEKRNEAKEKRDKATEVEEKLAMVEHVEALVEQSKKAFAIRLDFGMLGRGKVFARTMELIASARVSTAKEDLRPIAIISAPRQGKSLFLDEVAARLVEKHASTTVVLKINLNGDSQCKPVKTATEAMQYLWGRVFGGVTRTWDGETAKRTLGALYPGKLVLLIVDELPNLLDGMVESEMKSVARQLLSFYGENSVLMFTGFDARLIGSFKSASGRVPHTITLPPISCVSNDFRVLLPLKTLVLKQYILYKERLPLFPLLYEVSKVTPGMLGAIATTIWRDIPVIGWIYRHKKAFKRLFIEYTQYCIEKAQYPTVDLPLSQQLLDEKVALLTPDDKVIVPPVFAFAAFIARGKFFHIDTLNASHAAYYTAAAVVHMWVLERMAEESPEDGGRINGEFFEWFVYSCLAARLLLCPSPSARPRLLSFERINKDTAAVFSDKELRLECDYPVCQITDSDAVKLATEGVCMTRDGLQAVDIVFRPSPDTEQLVQVKHQGRLDDKYLEEKVGPCIQAFLENAQTQGITRVEYVLVGPLREDAALTNGLEELCKYAKGLGMGVAFSTRVVRLGTEDADFFLTPLLAAMAPDMRTFDDGTWEARLLTVCNASKDWLAIRTDKEFINSLSVCEKTLAADIIKKCKLASALAERLDPSE